jgi:hypothetical protein
VQRFLQQESQAILQHLDSERPILKEPEAPLEPDAP